MRTMSLTRTLGVLLLVAAASPALAGGHLASEHVKVMGAWSRALPPVSKNGAAYLMLKSAAKKSVRVVGGESPVAEMVELHTHLTEGGVMKMRKLEDGVEVPAGESVTFEPGGMHVMLMGLKKPLKSGEAFPLTLRFEDGGTASVEVKVMSPDEAPSMKHGHGEMKHGHDHMKHGKKKASGG